jgi:hypothetical protein
VANWGVARKLGCGVANGLWRGEWVRRTPVASGVPELIQVGRSLGRGIAVGCGVANGMWRY